MTDLTDTDRTLLVIFGQPWAYSGLKESAVRESTGLSITQATQRVNALIDTEAALAEFPQTVNRLRRLREVRHLSRPTTRRP